MGGDRRCETLEARAAEILGWLEDEPDLDLSRFRSGLLRAILAIEETGYGSDTQRRVQAGCGSHRTDQRPDEASGCV
jgi:hypothetical protein